METLKLISYTHVTYWHRAQRRALPRQLNLEGSLQLHVGSTLCYELKFPRTPGRRKTFLFKRTVELVAFSFVCVALCHQWVAPLVRNSVKCGYVNVFEWDGDDCTQSTDIEK
jgi:hypothetical protein